MYIFLVFSRPEFCDASPSRGFFYVGLQTRRVRSGLPSPNIDTPQSLWLRSLPAVELATTQEGGRAMESFEITELLIAVSALLAVVDRFVERLLPLLSDRVLARAVRLARARNKQRK